MAYSLTESTASALWVYQFCEILPSSHDQQHRTEYRQKLVPEVCYRGMHFVECTLLYHSVLLCATSSIADGMH